VRRTARKIDPEVAAALAVDDEPAVAQARAAYAAGNESLFAGDFEAAIESYRRAVDHAPSYAAGYRGLGLAHAVQGDQASALKALRTYLGLAPNAKDVALIKRRIAGLQASP
jgi:tetratricopeptide (TPR) repeat protein